MSGRRIEADAYAGYVDGVYVHFRGIALRREGIWISFQGTPSETTRGRDELHEQRMGEWSRRKREKSDVGDIQAPQMPGVDVLPRVGVIVSDDRGTTYEVQQGQVAGTGTEWDAWWFHSPTMPERATRLYLRFTVDSEPNGEHYEISVL